MNTPARLDTAASSRARFTTAEFLRMIEAGAFDDMKVELVDGELERMTPPMSSHAGRQARIAIRLAALVPEERLLGEVGIDLGDDTVLACDAAILTHAVEDDRLLRPDEVDLVVEAAETTVARDMGLKRIKYASAGIRRYWVVDGARAVIHVYAEPLDGDYAQISTVKFGEPLAVPGCDRAITLD